MFSKNKKNIKKFQGKKGPFEKKKSNLKKKKKEKKKKKKKKNSIYFNNNKYGSQRKHIV